MTETIKTRRSLEEVLDELKPLLYDFACDEEAEQGLGVGEEALAQTMEAVFSAFTPYQVLKSLRDEVQRYARNAARDGGGIAAAEWGELAQKLDALA